MTGKISNIFAKSFGIRVCKTQDNIFDFDKHKSIKEINSDKFLFKINPVNIAADPFLYVNNNTLYLFYEEMINFYGKGVIKLTKTKNLTEWSPPCVVLEENFHLSFPFVFQNGADLFMIPETGEDNSIRLYRPNSDLTEWMFYKKILSGNNYKDSSIFIKDGTLYLFTTIKSEKTLTLRLYFSDDIDKTWLEHPSSPICSGSKIARNGGSVFSFNGELYRPVQNCEKLYGENLAMYKISELSKEGYREELINEDIFPKNIPFYFLGGHHFNFVNFQNELIVASDGLQYDYNVFNLIQRLFNALKTKIELRATPITFYEF
jgi:hypothetical protein